MKMKPSTSLLPFFFILLLSTTQGIRFQPECLSQSHQQIQQEKSSIEGSAIGEVVICNDGHCSGTMKRRYIRAVKGAHHKLPEFHEDYYGPRNHKPKHH